MVRKRWIVGVVLVLGLALIGGAWKWLSAEPEWNPMYFTPETRERYATPEQCYEQYVAALQAADATLYYEVLGYDDPDVAGFPRYEGPMPEVEIIEVKGNTAFILTSTPERWEVNLEYINGRWVFRPERWAVLVRSALDLRNIVAIAD